MINISISKEQTKQILLVFFLTICMALAIFVVSWANEPERRPLIQNITLVDAVKIIDALEASDISYVTRLDNQMILVKDEDMDYARVALARIGIVIDYPDVRQMANASEACDILETKIFEYAQNPNTPITEKPYFLKLVKLMMGAMIIIVLIFSVVRPALRKLLEKYIDKDEP
ncbi:MAG: hypothetical protein ACSHW0_09775 [Thalassotalea sp.]